MSRFNSGSCLPPFVDKSVSVNKYFNVCICIVRFCHCSLFLSEAYCICGPNLGQRLSDVIPPMWDIPRI